MKRVVWFFEEGDMVHLSGLYGALERVVWYFVVCGVVFNALPDTKYAARVFPAYLFRSYIFIFIVIYM